MPYLRKTFLIVALAAAAGAVHAQSAPKTPGPQPQPQAPTPATPTISAPKPATPASDATLNAIRAQIKKGQFTEALAALKPLQATGPVVRLRIEAALGARDFAAALTALDELPGTERKDSNTLLTTIARAIIEDAGSRDDQMKLEACTLLLSHNASHPCAKELAARARKAEAPLPDRLRAAATLAARGDADALGLFRTLAAQASGRMQRSVVTAARDLPPADAVGLIAPALASPEADIQYTAASLLGDLPSPESRAALSKFLANGQPSVARSAARLSLAVLGEPAALEEAVRALPDLQGGDLVRLGIALMKRNDARGEAALTRALKDDRELTRIAAAAALSERSPEAARAVLMSALAHVNPLIRAAALEEFRTSPLLTALQARGLLLDTDPFVRMRAADAIVERLDTHPAAPGRDTAGRGTTGRGQPAKKPSSSATPPGAR